MIKKDLTLQSQQFGKPWSVPYYFPQFCVTSDENRGIRSNYLETKRLSAESTVPYIQSSCCVHSSFSRPTTPWT
jgi:hypothetical protein